LDIDEPHVLRGEESAAVLTREARDEIGATHLIDR